MLARATRGEKILYDLIRRMGLAQEELAQAKSRLARAERGSHSKAEFASLCEQLQEARVVLRFTQGKCDHAQSAVAKMVEELTTERQALEVATRSTEVFQIEGRDLRRRLESRTEEVGILQSQLSSIEATRVRAEGERDSLAEEVARLTAEKAAAEQLASDLQDDFDVGVEEARHAAAVECREATATENVSRGVTFYFFDSLFPPLDGIEPLGDELAE